MATKSEIAHKVRERKEEEGVVSDASSGSDGGKWAKKPNDDTALADFNCGG